MPRQKQQDSAPAKTTRLQSDYRLTTLDKVQYVNLTVDIHHIFPQKWCNEHSIDDEHPESIVNETANSATTNRTIGGAAPSSYLGFIERGDGKAVPRDIERGDAAENSSQFETAEIVETIQETG